MYISEIDKILDSTMDKFMYAWRIDKQNKLDIISYDKIMKDVNFIKYQKDINNILNIYSKILSDKEIYSFVTKNNNVIYIKNIINKYLAYYLFITIGINYKGNIKQFNNNIVEFNRNQSNYSISIDDFFNSESNSNIIKIIYLIQEFYKYS